MLQTPPHLKAADLVGIIPPASKIPISKILKAIEVLESWGLKVMCSSNFRSRYFEFAGSDNERLMALQTFLDNREIKAVFCARGGYGTSRIIDRLDLDPLRKFPKWVIGFSDITILLNKLFLNQIPSIHGPMPLNFFEDQATESLHILKEFLFEGKYPVIKFSTGSANKPGYAEGPVVGGNLTMLINGIGTKTHLDTYGKILFLEDVSEKLYRVDRMIVHMKRAGMLEGLKGMIIGHFTSMQRQDTFGFSLQDIISDHTEEFDFPVCFDAPVGHIMPNYPMIIGREIILDVEPGTASFQLK